MEKHPPNLNAGLISYSSFLLEIADLELAKSEIMTKLKFLRDQMELNKCDKFGVCYPSNTMREAINLYLRGWNAY